MWGLVDTNRITKYAISENFQNFVSFDAVFHPFKVWENGLWYTFFSSLLKTEEIRL